MATEDEDEAREAHAEDRGQAEEPHKPSVEPSPFPVDEGGQGG